MSYLLRPLDPVAGDKLNNPRQQRDEVSSISDAAPSRRAAEAAGRPRFLVEQAQLGPESRVVVYTDPHGAGADRFRHLRMRLRELKSAENCRSLLVTSALPRDGKSTVSLNLATALTEHGKRSVLLIEADLHHPTLTQELLLKPWPGLADCLEGRLKPLVGIRRVDPLGCCLLPAGEPHHNPSELLQSDDLASIMQELRPYFDWIVMDAPPLRPLTDALSLARHAHASLLVVRAGRTPKSAVEEAVTSLGTNHVAGIVLNALDGVHREYSNYYGYSYAEKSRVSATVKIV